jgi:hypothetical protein
MTTPVGHTGVYFFILNGTLKESLTGLAGEKTIMVSGHFIATHGTQFFYSFLSVGLIVSLMSVV